MANARPTAVKILNKFYHKGNIRLEDIFLEFTLKDLDDAEQTLSGSNKRLIYEIIHGVVRWQIWLDFILQNYIDMKKTRPAIVNILRATFYQILFLDKIPNYACCNEAVEIVKSTYMKNAEPLARLVNGVLHAFIRDIKQKRDFSPQTPEPLYNIAIKYSHPEWTVKRLIEQYGQLRTEKILSANNSKPKLSIRINSNLITNQHAIEELTTNNINIFLNISKTNNIIVDANIEAIKKLDLWANGSICIQDASSTLCAILCNPQPGDLIFDLCSAPGGKTMLLAELIAKHQNPGTIISNDIDASRLKKCEENIQRMKYSNINITNYDVFEFDYPQKADIVLLDAPCSGLGTIRKNVDIKHLRDETQLQASVALQRQMLTKASSLLKNGGHLIYSVCSIDKDEGENNIKWLLDNDSRYELEDANNFVSPEWTDGKYLSTVTMLSEGITDGLFATRLKFKEN